MNPCKLLLCSAICVVTAGAVSAGDSDWSQWRGPDGTGFVADSNPPIEWSETKNIRWKTAIPGQGHASPVVHGDRIYVMTAVQTDKEVKREDAAATTDAGSSRPEQGRRGGRGGRGGRRGGMGAQAPTHVYQFNVIALDRNDGNVLWSRTVREETPHQGVHPTGTHASNSPITDGERIYAHFGSRGLYCLDLDGNVVWEADLGRMQPRMSFGEGASPALHDGMLIVPWDHEGDSFVAAFDASSGTELWRTPRDEHTTWATPVVVDVNGRTQVIMPATGFSISYDLETGKEIWRCSGMTANVIPTPVVGHGMVYLISGFRGNALQAVKLTEAKGDISGSDAIAWTHDRSTPYTPSPMLAGRNLYFLGSNNGILSCFDAVTGEAHYTGQRLDVVRNVYASIVGAGGHVYICGREGNVAVVRDGPQFEQIATNTLDAGINSTPAIVGDEIILRTDTHLYCISEAGE